MANNFASGTQSRGTTQSYLLCIKIGGKSPNAEASSCSGELQEISSAPTTTRERGYPPSWHQKRGTVTN